jgi:hypothetical protein
VQVVDFPCNRPPGVTACFCVFGFDAAVRIRSPPPNFTFRSLKNLSQDLNYIPLSDEFVVLMKAY